MYFCCRRQDRERFSVIGPGLSLLSQPLCFVHYPVFRFETTLVVLPPLILTLVFFACFPSYKISSLNGNDVSKGIFAFKRRPRHALAHVVVYIGARIFLSGRYGFRRAV